MRNSIIKEFNFLKQIDDKSIFKNSKVDHLKDIIISPICKYNYEDFPIDNYFESQNILHYVVEFKKTRSILILELNGYNEILLNQLNDFLDEKILNVIIDYLSDIFLCEIIYPNKKLSNSHKSTLILTAGPSISHREKIYVNDALIKGWNNEWSKYLNKFQNSFAEYIGVKFSIATSSCTGAMQLALMALDIGQGDEGIVPDVTWVSTANVVHAVGATPIFADVDIDTWTIDPKSIESKITDKTKAIMPVHMYGHPADMDAIINLTTKYNLKIIEDAAPSIGALYKGKKTGSFGDFSAFSFQGAKLLVTGEGGMLCTNDESLYKKAYRLWDQGRIPGTFWIEEHGPKYKMSNIQAALGLGQLERIDLMIEKKRQINNWYKSRLNQIDEIIFWDESKDVKSICWMTSIRLTKKIKLNREQFCLKLKERNIDSRPVFPSISQYPYWRKKQDSQNNSKIISNTGINLPSGVCLSKAEVDYICDSIIDIIKNDK